MRELGAGRAAREEKTLAELAEKFPAWDVERVWNVGFVAFPKGTRVLRSIDIEAMKEKLENQRDQSPG